MAAALLALIVVISGALGQREPSLNLRGLARGDDVTLSASQCEGFVLPEANGQIVTTADPEAATVSVLLLDHRVRQERQFTVPYGASACANNPTLADLIESSLLAACAPPRLAPGDLPVAANRRIGSRRTVFGGSWSDHWRFRIGGVEIAGGVSRRARAQIESRSTTVVRGETATVGRFGDLRVVTWTESVLCGEAEYRAGYAVIAADLTDAQTIQVAQSLSETDEGRL